MKYVFVFSGGPLDGNGLSYDDEAPCQPLDFGKRAFEDSGGGDLGRQFIVENPDTPRDPDGGSTQLRTHVYEVARREMSASGKTLLHCKHIREVLPMQGR